MTKELVSFDEDRERIDLIKSLYCKGASDEELKHFMYVCAKTGLDPMMKQIYSIKRRNYENSGWVERMTIQTSIDGQRLVAERTGKYAPGRATTYTYDKDGNILSATSYVKKLTNDGTWHEISATAFFNEFCQKSKDGKPSKFWLQMGHVMLGKCAESQALRKAFPDYLSGLYTTEEMMQADVEILDNPNDKINPYKGNKKIECAPTEEPNKDQVNIEPIVETLINQQQIEEITVIMNGCGPEYKEKVMKRLEKRGVTDISKMHTTLYEAVKKSCLEEIERQGQP